MSNPWKKHVAEVSKKNKGKSLSDILKLASKSYKKSSTHKFSRRRK